MGWLEYKTPIGCILMRVLPRCGQSTHTKEEIRCFCRKIIVVFFPEVFLYVSRRCLHFRGTSLHDYLVRISACWCCTTIMHASFNLSRRAPLHQRQEVSPSITPPRSGVLHAPRHRFLVLQRTFFVGAIPQYARRSITRSLVLQLC